MKYRIIYLIIILYLFISICYADDITLNKKVEYQTGGVYFDKDQLGIKDQYLFATSIYGLETYEVEPNTPAQLISRLPLLGDARAIEIKDNYAYVQSISYYEWCTYIYKIDITDVCNPYIVKTIFNENENGYAKSDTYNDFIIFRNWDNNYNFYYRIYSIPDLEFIQNYYCTNLFRKLNDSLALQRYSEEVFTLYDFSDPENITAIRQINFSAGGIPIDNIEAVNDTILACLDFEGIAFWNYSDINNIQYVSTIYSSADENWGSYIYSNGDFVFVLHTRPPGLKSIDISNIFEPFVSDSVIFNTYSFFHTGLDIGGTDNTVFAGENYFINQIGFNNGYFSEQFTIGDNYQLLGGVIYNEYLYINFKDGLKIYDVSSLPDIIHVNTLFEGNKLYSMQRVDDFLFLMDYTDHKIVVLDITNPASPVIRNEISIPSPGTLILTDSPYVIYYVRDDNNKLYKYSIPEPNDYTLNFQYNLNYDGNGFIYNDYFYYLSENSSRLDLQIYGGLEENNPELIMIYENFAEGYYGAYIQNYDSFFYLSTWDDLRDSTRFYEIGEPTEINHRFSTPHRCNGEFFIDGNYLYAGGKFSHIYIFDLETASGSVEPMADYQDYGSNLYCKEYESTGQKYLYHFQSTAFSIYEIEGYGVDDVPEVKDQLFTSYPNPFSTMTTISYNATTNLHELSQINIYNIKGQLVKTITSFPNSSLGMREAVWDGCDDKGNDVRSGVYLYKLNNNDEHIGKVVKLR